MNASEMRGARFLLCLASCCCYLAFIGSVMGQVDWPQLDFTRIAGGLSAPTSIADPGDGSGRLFVTEQSGRILLVQSNAVRPFLDLQDRVHFFEGTELGLLSVAFDPGFATNHAYYVFYNRQIDRASTISRFQLSSTNTQLGDPTTEQPVLVIPQADAPYTLSGGLLLFGPDRFLYIGMGDAGFGVGVENKAQDPRAFHGKILRIDVSNPAMPYAIPIDNPFVGQPEYLPEVWALGVRNPWRFSFDRETGDFYLGDVGHTEFEEINFKAATNHSAQNYGWPLREGGHLYSGPEPNSPPRLTDPVAEFSHAGPGSVTGGFVYRGPDSPRLQGTYLYADFYSGVVWGLRQDGAGWVTQELAHTPYFISTFGEDSAGQVYVADYIGGEIYRITDNGAAAPPVFAPPGTNSFLEMIALNCVSPRVTIRYTTDGRDPEARDPGIDAGRQVQIRDGTLLKARAFRGDLLPSPVASMTYHLRVARPSFRPPQGPITNGQPIDIVCATPGAVIRYTLDGAEPTGASELYSAPLTYRPGIAVKARAFQAGFEDSPVAVFEPSSLFLHDLLVLHHGLEIWFSCPSLPGRRYQMQVADDPTQWRDVGAAKPGTGGTLRFLNDNVPPLPSRRLFRVKAMDDLGL